MPPFSKAILLLLALGSLPATALTMHIDSQAGLMQQPTSHYYHLIYGVQTSLVSATERLVWRAAYFERPSFKKLGYEDKDYGWYTTVGTKLTKSKDSGVFAAVGGGTVSGYIRSLPGAAGIDQGETRSFRLIGPTASLDYELNFGPLTWSIGHRTFIGFVDRSEVMAYVAWPYNFFQTTLGFTW